MRVGCDLDNVIVNILDSARIALANDLDLPVGEILDTFIYGSPFTHRDSEIASRMQLDHAFWNREDVLFNSDPIEGSIEAAWRLYDAGLLACYITRRAPEVADLTQRWLAIHGYPAVPVEHVGTVSNETYYETCKSSVCQAYGVTHMIDDHTHEAEALTKAGIEVVVIDAPIARAERRAFIKRHPHVRMVETAGQAADLLLNDFRAAA